MVTSITDYIRQTAFICIGYYRFLSLAQHITADHRQNLHCILMIFPA
ncbi:hypothetical protein [Snodgrassella sp. ESL0253]|nr:hypothetical protein [Snodgrassella sp. ESL0253]NUE67214.1 hypothetical protein [Snodgrassella sp. ESL0253]